MVPCQIWRDSEAGFEKLIKLVVEWSETKKKTVNP